MSKVTYRTMNISHAKHTRESRASGPNRNLEAERTPKSHRAFASPTVVKPACSLSLEVQDQPEFMAGFAAFRAQLEKLSCSKEHAHRAHGIECQSGSVFRHSSAAPLVVSPANHMGAQ